MRSAKIANYFAHTRALIGGTQDSRMESFRLSNNLDLSIYNSPLKDMDRVQKIYTLKVGTLQGVGLYWDLSQL